MGVATVGVSSQPEPAQPMHPKRPSHILWAVLIAPEAPNESHICAHAVGCPIRLPIKKLMLGQPQEKVVNKDAMANPGCLGWYVDLANRHLLEIWPKI